MTPDAAEYLARIGEMYARAQSPPAESWMFDPGARADVHVELEQLGLIIKDAGDA